MLIQLLPTMVSFFFPQLTRKIICVRLYAKIVLTLFAEKVHFMRAHLHARINNLITSAQVDATSMTRLSRATATPKIEGACNH